MAARRGRARIQRTEHLPDGETTKIYFAGQSQAAPRLKLATLGLLAATLLLFFVDAITYRVKIGRGTAYKEVAVNQFLLTPLKGQKEEYDVVGSTTVTCSRTIFPQPGYPACWWQQRHTAQWQ